jgi:hypothetical protein
MCSVSKEVTMILACIGVVTVLVIGFLVMRTKGA